MKTKNSSPSSEFEDEDKCPSCGSPCDIHSDLDDNDECNDCRNEIDGLQIWQRSYSEEEVIEILSKSCDYIYASSKIGTDKKLMPNLLKGWFEQFKNK